MIDTAETDVLILGAGGAGLCAALHAADASAKLRVTVVVKGLLGRAGCTRMVQGGYNAVLTEPDSLEAHLLDTLAGGGFINDQASPQCGRSPSRSRAPHPTAPSRSRP